MNDRGMKKWIPFIATSKKQNVISEITNDSLKNTKNKQINKIYLLSKSNSKKLLKISYKEKNQLLIMTGILKTIDEINGFIILGDKKIQIKEIVSIEF